MKVSGMIIGAGRSGTTTVYEYLKQHPDIVFSITKEVHYFSIPELYARGEKYFHSLFPNVNGDNLFITADTYLLMDNDAPERIKLYNPAMKFIVILREPVARAYSNYNYSVNFGHEKKGISFLETIALEPERLKHNSIADRNNLCHFYGSLYYKHLSYWMQYFPRGQFIILKTGELKDPQSSMDRIYAFLGLGKIRITEVENQNKTVKAKSKFLQQVLLDRDHWLRRSTRFIARPFRNLIIQSGIIEKISRMNKENTTPTPLTADEVKIAGAYFTEDKEKLASELGIRF